MVILLSGCKTASNEPKEIAIEFLKNVVNQDWEIAKSLSSGEVLFTLSQLEKNKTEIGSVRLVDLSVESSAISANWAEVSGRAELELKDGGCDVSWYKIEMMQRDGSWKIYRMKLIEPELTGSSDNESASVVTAAKEVFKRYLTALSKNDWQTAVNCLSGQARRSQEASKSILGTTSVIKEVGDINIKHLWSKDKIMICKASYMVDGRSTNVSIIFYKTIMGWKIVQLVNC